jgi:3-deoxy-manno-octulosonate cytidylyltransferase (CMP-KDO synthetase)
MVEHVYRRAADAQLVDVAIVATDDDRIAQVVADFGGIAVMTRGDHATGSDRLAEVAASLESDLIVNVQGDEPLLSSAAIDLAVNALHTDTSDPVSTLRRHISDPEDLDNPAVVKVAVDLAGYALYFSRAPVPYVRRAGASRPLLHVGVYGYQRAALLELAALEPSPLEITESLEQLRALENGYPIRVLPSSKPSIGVDTAADLERVERMIEAGRDVEGRGER